MHDSFDPRSYGAVADGHTKDTAAVQAAIDAAAAQGGTVRLAGGIFVCGTLYLKSNVALKITNSATLLASPDIADYGTDTHHNRYRNEPELDRCFLFAQDAENITICGSGIIDGNAAAFPNAGSIYRPMLLRVLRCRNVRVTGLRLLNAAAWTTAFLDSDFLWATDLHIENHRNYNGDGLDFDGCRHVWVRGCCIDGTDDNLCLQSSGLPVQDVHISDCAFTSVCAGIRIGLKSIGEISNIVISNCTMRNIRREGIKLECTEGGSITDVLVENITMHNVRRPPDTGCDDSGLLVYGHRRRALGRFARHPLPGGSRPPAHAHRPLRQRELLPRLEPHHPFGCPLCAGAYAGKSALHHFAL